MSASKRPAAAVLAIGILVIALTTTVISGQVGASTVLSQRQQPAAEGSGQKVASPTESAAPKVVEVVVAAAPASPADSPQAAGEPKEAQQSAASPLEPRKDSPASSEQAARSEASPADSKAAAPTETAEASKRKGRSEPAPAAAPVSTETTGKPGEMAPAEEKPTATAATTPATAEKAASTATEKLATKSATTTAASKPAKSQLTGKSGPKSKLPANLGTVTSTGSGGPAHYMSKHDAYSAIAEKHGALAQEALHHRKTDKRSGHLHGGLSGIQKASGFGDALGIPFKGVSDSGLARTLGASMRSIMKSKYSVPAYVASALLGAVALMAFYESPISPLPVPALPEPPVGRFPPEMPNIPVNTQVPFRGGNQQQQQQYYNNYNQRSSTGGAQMGAMMIQGGQQQQQQQPQQVLFPGSSANQAQALPAQQRQSGAAGGGVQQLAANLLSSVAKPQVAQRKSGIDYDYSASSRSFFGGSPSTSNQKMSSGPTVGSQQKQQQAGNSFLSYFGFGGSSSEPAATTGGQQHLGAPNLNLAQAAMGPIAASFASSGIEPKGGQSGSSAAAGGIANSNLINRVRSFFSRAPASQASSSSGSSSSNSANQQPRPSFLQTLMSFDSSYLSPLRKSFPSTSSPFSSSSGGNKLQQSGAFSQASGAQSPASRIGGASSDLVGQASGAQQQMLTVTGKQQQQQQQKPASAISYGFMNRIAHALLETFTSGGVSQRNSVSSSSSASQHGGSDRKSSVSGDDSHHQQSPLASATSLLTDIMTSYGANVMAGAVAGDQQTASGQQQQQQQHEQAKSSAQQQPASESSSSNSNNSNNSGQPQQASGRSDEAPEIITAEDVNVHFQPQKQQQINVMVSNKQQVSASSGAAQASPVSAGQQPSSQSDAQVAAAASNPISAVAAGTGAVLTRKTRSIGLEYPVDSNQELMHKQGQQQLHPSRAAQINNVIDFVADSYSQNRLLFNFVMNQVGLSQAVPYVEQILAPGNNEHH